MEIKEMEIKFDMDCMSDEMRRKMEAELNNVLMEHGWSMWAQGADCQENTVPRKRDIALRHCPDMDCEHWDGRSGCDAPKMRCRRV